RQRDLCSDGQATAKDAGRHQRFEAAHVNLQRTSPHGQDEIGDAADMSVMTETTNRALVLVAFDTLFNKRDYAAAMQYWSPNYVQHSAHIPPGRDGLFNLVRALPLLLKYEPGLIVAEGDYVIVHGRFSGHGRPRRRIAADILR